MAFFRDSIVDVRLFMVKISKIVHMLAKYLSLFFKRAYEV